MSANDTSGIPGWDFFTRAAETMRQTPFGAAMGTGLGTGMPGAGAPWSMMTDMLAPLTNIDDLDRRINEVRAVEQWLKLNLGMVQSTAQALEVQRATLATLKAFGSMAGSGGGTGFAQAGFPFGAPAGGGTSTSEAKAPPAGQAGQAGQTGAGAQAGAAGASNPFTGASATGSVHGMPDMSAATEGAAAWWRMLNDQFSQIAGMAGAGLTPGGNAGAARDAAASPAAGTAGAAGRPAPEGAAPEGAEPDDPAAAARRRRKP